MNINQYAVYQLKESAELAAYRSRSYQWCGIKKVDSLFSRIS